MTVDSFSMSSVAQSRPATTAMKVQGELTFGYVLAGFEPVLELFESNYKSRRDCNSQLCVYWAETKIIDLWCGSRGKNEEIPGKDEATTRLGPDSLVNVFSSSKCFTSIVTAKLVDAGLLRYTDKIKDVWPEFKGDGKENITLADLLRHEAGLPDLDESLQIGDFSRDNIRQNKVGRLIERQKPRFRDFHFNKREYHSFTRGWILNEICRRVDPRGRTIGEILEEDICAPLRKENDSIEKEAGECIDDCSAECSVDAFIGLTDEQISTVFHLENLSLGYLVAQSLIPQYFGRVIEPSIFGLAEMASAWIHIYSKASSRRSPEPFVGKSFRSSKDVIDFFNSPEVKRVELPSANGHASARGMAKLAAMMANGGSWKGIEILSPSTVQQFHQDPLERDMSHAANYFTQGGVSLYKMPSNPTPKEIRNNSGLEGFYGWGGFGGSQMQWNLEEKLGFAYVPTSLFWIDITNGKARDLQKTVLQCVQKFKL